MEFHKFKDRDLTGKLVLVRVNFDMAPETCEQARRYELSKVLPTLDSLVKRKAKIIIISHKTPAQNSAPPLDYMATAGELAALWKRKFVVLPESAQNFPEYDVPHLYYFPGKILQPKLRGFLERLKTRDAVVLENLYEYEKDAANQENFVKSLASLGDFFVNEAFCLCDQQLFSLGNLPDFLPSAAGLSLQRETEVLARIANHPKRPVVLLLGGKVTSEKLRALEEFAVLADKILLGGIFANLFLSLTGYNIGKSEIPAGPVEKMARQIWRDHKDKICLPRDLVVSAARTGMPDLVFVSAVKPSQTIFDIGPETIESYSEYLKQADTLIWCGSLGVAEIPAFSHGTKALAWLVASRSKTDSLGMAGGQRTLTILSEQKLLDFLDYIFVSGGAMLTVLSGQIPPDLSKLIV